jgi:hypothetical protein
MKTKLAGLVSLLSLSACASIITGTHQDIAVTTSPTGATCAFTKQGATVGSLSATPGMLQVEKTKYDLQIACKKPGYDEVSMLNHSGIEPWTFGNIVIGGVIGWGIDSALGADNKYTTPVNLTLSPSAGAAVTPLGGSLTNSTTTTTTTTTTPLPIQPFTAAKPVAAPQAPASATLPVIQPKDTATSPSMQAPSGARH